MGDHFQVTNRTGLTLLMLSTPSSMDFGTSGNTAAAAKRQQQCNDWEMDWSFGDLRAGLGGKEKEEARRCSTCCSEHTRSLLRPLLLGKSPCLWVESASGRPPGIRSRAGSDTCGGAATQGLLPIAAAQLCHG
mmetsp:Transcript_63976/g.114679  ORF Transcript_63976/g.114679 Transcript_63976/m.114679 type:complete len:133 (+) Transcript_63976:277-675(+)